MVKAVRESVNPYSGLKHSSCSQYVNEKGLSIYEREITNHAKLASVRKYAKVSSARRVNQWSVKFGCPSTLLQGVCEALASLSCVWENFSPAFILHTHDLVLQH